MFVWTCDAILPHRFLPTDLNFFFVTLLGRGVSVYGEKRSPILRVHVPIIIFMEVVEHYLFTIREITLFVLSIATLEICSPVRRTSALA